MRIIRVLALISFSLCLVNCYGCDQEEPYTAEEYEEGCDDCSPGSGRLCLRTGDVMDATYSVTTTAGQSIGSDPETEPGPQRVNYNGFDDTGQPACWDLRPARATITWYPLDDGRSLEPHDVIIVQGQTIYASARYGSPPPEEFVPPEVPLPDDSDLDEPPDAGSPPDDGGDLDAGSEDPDGGG